MKQPVDRHGCSWIESSQVVDETLFVDRSPPDVRFDRLQRLLELALCRAEVGLARHEVGDVTQLPVSREALCHAGDHW